MSPVTIRARARRDGRKSYQVRYRLGGRETRVRGAGTFPTLKLARARADLVAGLIARGDDPALVLARLENPDPVLTLAGWCDRWLASDTTKPQTRTNHAQHVRHVKQGLGGLLPERVTAQAVQEFAAALGLAPATVRKIVQTLRVVLDYAGVDPNPARDRRVRLPKVPRRQLTPPTADHVLLVLRVVTPGFRLPVLVLEQTGLRVGELAALTWADLDLDASRFLVRTSKTDRPRWVPVPAWVMRLVLDGTPPDDRTPDRRVFPLGDSLARQQAERTTGAALRRAIARACRSAGVPVFSPHDLRHRWISIRVAGGVPITEITAVAGHEGRAMTLDTYSHVMVDVAPVTLSGVASVWPGCGQEGDPRGNSL